MQKFNLLEIEKKIEHIFDTSTAIELCQFGLELDDEIYFYGSVDQKGCFIVDKNGELLSKNESISIFKNFLQAEIILGDNLNHFQQSSRRSLTIFEQLLARVNRFYQKHSIKYKDTDKIFEPITTMVHVIREEQIKLVDRCKELEEIKEKIHSSTIITENDVKKIVRLNSELNFSLYSQVKIIHETTESIILLNKFLKEQLPFSQKYKPNVLAIHLILKQFISNKMIENNKNQLETFEITANGEYINFGKGNMGLNLLDESLNRKFEDTFTNNYINYLLN